MTDVLLDKNDPRLGTLNAEGGIKTWPAQNFHGEILDYSAPGTRANATIRQVGGGFFVVMGVQRDDPELIISVGNPRRAASFTAPAQGTQPNDTQPIKAEGAG